MALISIDDINNPLFKPTNGDHYVAAGKKFIYQEPPGAFVEESSEYVKISGDTMTGPLVQHLDTSTDPNGTNNLATTAPVDTKLEFRYQGSDDVVRCVTLPLGCCQTIVSRPKIGVGNSTQGTARDGDFVEIIADGAISPAASIDEIQWERETALGTGVFNDIAGEVNRYYTMTASDAGKRIRVRQVFNKDDECEVTLYSNVIVSLDPTGTAPQGFMFEWNAGTELKITFGRSEATQVIEIYYLNDSGSYEVLETVPFYTHSVTWDPAITEYGHFIIPDPGVNYIAFDGSSADTILTVDEQSYTSNLAYAARMFKGLELFDQDLIWWNTENIVDMVSMFEDCKSFNGDVSTWDTLNVTNMHGMFRGAESFNGSLTSWDMSNVENITRMFQGAVAFNKSLSGWDVSSVKRMSHAFHGAVEFNGDITSWTPVTATSMDSMFREAVKFDQNIGTWNVSSVEYMNSMFYGATSFNQDLGGWNTSSVADMSEMFAYTDLFDQDLSQWETGNVADMVSMFVNASVFNHDISTWCVNLITSRPVPFSDGGFVNWKDDSDRQPKWGLCPLTAVATPVIAVDSPAKPPGAMPDEILVITQDGAVEENIDPANQWQVQTGVGTGSYTDIAGETGETYTVLPADLGKNLRLKQTFVRPDSLPGDEVMYSNAILADAGYPPTDSDFAGVSFAKGTMSITVDQGEETPIWKFDQGYWREVGSFAVGSNLKFITTEAGTYIWLSETTTALSFKGTDADAGLHIDPNTFIDNVEDASEFFDGVADQNQDLSFWNTAKLTNASGMFKGCTGWRKDVSWMDTSNVTNMSSMFEGATAFDGSGTSSFDVSKVQDFSKMFSGASSVNEVITNWDTSSATNMAEMFKSAAVYDQPLAHFETGAVGDMASMFSGAAAFVQDLTSWCVTLIASEPTSFRDGTPTGFNDDLQPEWGTCPPKANQTPLIGIQGSNMNVASYNQILELTRSGAVDRGLVPADQWQRETGINSGIYADIAGETDQTGYTVLTTDQSLGIRLKQTFADADGSLNLYSNVILVTNAAPPPEKYFAWTHTVTTVNFAVEFDGAPSNLFKFNATNQAWVETNASNGSKLDPGSYGIESTNMTRFTFSGTAAGCEGLHIDEGSYTGRVNSMRFSFIGIQNYNQDLSWMDTSNVVTFEGCFERSSFNGSLDGFVTAKAENLASMFFSDKAFNKPVDSWNVSNVTNLYRTFDGCENFSQDLQSWDVSSVTNFSTTFNSCRSFNLPLSSWNVSNGVDFSSMFGSTDIFNQDLRAWGTKLGNATNMSSMFASSKGFNGNVSTWTFRALEPNGVNVQKMFEFARVFNQPLPWVTDNLKNFKGIFNGAEAFDQPLPWNMSNAVNTAEMFGYTRNFDQNLAAWDVGNVVNMANMFKATAVFNTSINAWNVSNVGNMCGLFWQSAKFDKDLDGWDTFNVTNMAYMFRESKKFNKDISGWCVPNVHTSSSYLPQNYPQSESAPYFSFDGSFTDYSKHPTWGTCPAFFSTDPKIQVKGDANAATVEEGGVLDQYYNGILENENSEVASVTSRKWQRTTSSLSSTYEYITGATSKEYTTGSFDVDRKVRCEVTVIKDGKTAVAFTNSIEVEAVSIPFDPDKSIGIYHQGGGNLNIYAKVTGAANLWATLDNGNNWSKEYNWQDGWLDWENEARTGLYVIEASNCHTLNFDQSTAKFEFHTASNMSKVTNAADMFWGCYQFNQDLSWWDSSPLKNCAGMFGGDGRLSTGHNGYNRTLNLNTSNVTNMYKMFYDHRGMTSNSALAGLNTSNVVNMNSLMYSANPSNCIDWAPDMSGWDVGKVRDFSGAFGNRKAFTVNLSRWNTVSAQNMVNMFTGTLGFNSDISGWNVSNVTAMHFMFNRVDTFNRDLTGWCVRKVATTSAPSGYPQNKMPSNFASSFPFLYTNHPIWDRPGCPATVVQNPIIA